MEKCIFWDSDGTLLYSNESFRDSLVMACRKNKVSITPQKAKEQLKKYCSWYNTEKIYKERTDNLWWSDLLTNLSEFLETLADSSTVTNILIDFKQNVIEYKYKKFPYAKNILKYAKKLGFKNYIISNNFPELDVVMNRLGLGEYLEGCYLSSKIGYEKPRKEIFEYAFEKSGFPDFCYVIGDNPIADMQGGKSINAKTILVHNKNKNEYCDFSAKSLQNIKKILKIQNFEQ